MKKLISVLFLPSSVDIVPHLIHVAANKKSASSSEHVAAAVAADYLLPPAPSAHQLLLSDRLDELEPTHRGLHRFQPRHKACYMQRSLL